MLTAIDGKRFAGDESGFVGDKKAYCAGNFFRLTTAADADALYDRFQNVFWDGLHHVRADIAGSNGINGNAARCGFARQRFSEAKNSGLGGRIVGLSELAELSVDGGNVDNAAEFA